LTKAAQQQQYAINPHNNRFTLQYYRILQREYQYIDIIRTGVQDRLGVNKTIRSDNLYINHRFSESYINAAQEEPDKENLLNFYDVIKQYQRLVVLGDPGIGKTTMVSRIATIFTDLSLQFPETYDFPIPFPVTLREFNFSKKQNFKDFLKNQYFKTDKLKECEPDWRLIETALKTGQAFIIFDGIDEISNPTQRKHLAEMILELFEQYPDNKVWFTSRILGFDSFKFFSKKDETEQKIIETETQLFKKHESVEDHLKGIKKLLDPQVFKIFNNLNIKELYLAPFTNSQINQFARFWAVQYHPRHSDQSKYAQEFVTALEKHTKIKALARIPFLLTMMSLYFKINRRFPDGRVQLYKQIAKVYLDEMRTRNLPQFVSEFTLNEQMVGLSAIAYEMQKLRAEDKKKPNIIISREQAEQFFRQGLEGFGLCSNKENVGEYVKSYFDGLNKRSEILIPKSETQYAFIHLSYQEYFAAEYWYRRYQKIKSTSFKNDHKVEKKALFDEISKAANQDSYAEAIELFFECFKSDESSYIPEEIDYVFNEVFGRYFKRYFGVYYSPHKIIYHIITNAFINQAISLTTLHSIGALNISGINQINFKIIRQLKNLEILRFDDKTITDLSPLKDFSRLWSLYFARTQVNDLSPLSELYNLESLFFWNTQVNDLSPLKDLSQLRELYISDTKISDLSPLKGLQHLKYLSCDKGLDVSPLKHLKDLEISKREHL